MSWKDHLNQRLVKENGAYAGLVCSNKTNYPVAFTDKYFLEESTIIQIFNECIEKKKTPLQVLKKEFTYSLTDEDDISTFATQDAQDDMVVASNKKVLIICFCKNSNLQTVYKDVKEFCEYLCTSYN